MTQSMEKTEKAAPPRSGRSWPLGATLSVPCGLTVLVLFFLPWYHVIGGLDFGEPKLLFTVSGLDRARGFDLRGRIENTHVGYRQLGGGEPEPISPLALGPLAVGTRVAVPSPWVSLVPTAAVCLMGLAIVRLTGSGGRTVGAVMLVVSLTAAAATAVEAGYLLGETVRWEAAPGSFAVTAERHLALHMTFGVAAFAALCGVFDVIHPVSSRDSS